MRRTVLLPAVAAAALSFTAVQGEAQVFTPSYQSPVVMNDVGIYLSDSPGELALEGIWRNGPVGLRVGFADTEPEAALSLGGELRMPLTAPIDIAFTAAAQGLIAEDANALGLQAGLSLGQRIVNPGVALTPYIHPRVALLDRGTDDFETELLAEVGLDAEFSQNLILRLSVGLSDDSPDVGIGLAWRR